MINKENIMDKLKTFVLTHRFLPQLYRVFSARTVNALLTHRNGNYVQLAIDFLYMVTIQFGDSIRHGLASKEYTIGVDVAAEQRFERCTKCKNALFQVLKLMYIQALCIAMFLMTDSFEYVLQYRAHEHPSKAPFREGNTASYRQHHFKFAQTLAI